jgi:acyl-CoA synthetase (AMP-forming)/AMP-acid ligase II
MSEPRTIAELLAGIPAERPAFAAPDEAPLSHGGLRQLSREIGTWLNGRSIGRNDRVAIVLPNGAAMAAAFVTVAQSATTAPLNPAYREDEFDFYLDDLAARALIIAAGAETPARIVAHRRGIPILELTHLADGAGRFALSGDGPGSGGGRPGHAADDDIALVLHTSGTTARPKMVPLTQANLVASARHIGAALALSPADRCLNIMPLFHIHGLIGCVTASLAAGGSIFCTPGFNALKFFAWLTEAAATWYSAVPTMHQAILGRAERNREAIAARPLRFIRSSSASLPPQVMAALEAAFLCPVIESYGMTEATHQMTSNPLPPAPRRAGTVGRPAGPEVAIMDESGRRLPPGAVGEVVIRGPNVTPGYHANPAANESAFAHGWFHTGDQGMLDDEGYLTITGRLKELINRGGEKISPREVDEVLLDHPAVAQVVTFALPHDKLGEDVAAAVVLHEGTAAEERELRDFVARRLADFKVPRRILFLAEIPKGATGKLQRIGLAAKLGLVP